MNPESCPHPSPSVSFAPQLERFREKLLDLSKSNPLLNYRKSTRTIQIVDELPDQIFERLILERKQFRFQCASPSGDESRPKACPTLPPDSPQNVESLNNDALQSAGRNAHPSPALPDFSLGQNATLEGTSKSSDEAEEIPRVEEPAPLFSTSFEDAPRKTADSQKLAHELPEPGADNEPKQERHEDDILQTSSLDSEKLDAQLKSIAQRAKSAIEETGVNYLSLALGSVLWSETDSPDGKKHVAPLLLIPVRLDRVFDQRSSKYTYKLAWTEEEIQHNLCLERKLQRDFALKLPQFEEESHTPETYFEEVRKAIQPRDGWRICREAFLGFFSFHKLMMYLDADPENWAGKSESDLALANAILCGSEAPFSGTSLYAGEYRLDEETRAQNIPLVIDADSSQHSALFDICEGKSIVIEGPPGTGKSQTITNAIAAAMHQGKSILFVAEKLAALEVVQKKLEAAGLGDFCLALHSDDATPTRVLESIRQRMDRKFTAPRQIETLQGHLDQSRNHLNEYLRLQKMEMGPNKETFHDLQWKVAAARLAGVPSLEDPTVVPNPTSAEFQSNKTQLKTFERMVLELKDPQKLPWCGFSADRVLPNDQGALLATFRQMLQIGTRIREVLTQNCEFFGGDHRFWFSWNTPEKLSALAALEPVIERAKQVAHWPPLANEKNRALASALIDKVRAHHELREKKDQLGAVTLSFTEEEIAFVADFVPRFLLTHLGDFSLERIRSLSSGLTELASTIPCAQKVCADLEELGLGAVSCIGDFERMHEFLAAAQAPVPGDDIRFSRELFMSDPQKIFEDARQQAAAFVEDQRVIERSFYIESVPDSAEILNLEKRLRTHSRSWFRWCSADFWRARRALFSFTRPELGSDLSVWLRSLETLRTLKARREAFESSPQWRAFFGDRFNGSSTQWDTLKSFVDWVEKFKALGISYDQALHQIQKLRPLPHLREASANILKRFPTGKISSQEWTALELPIELLLNANFSELEKWAVGMIAALNLVERVLSVCAGDAPANLTQLHSRFSTLVAWKKSELEMADPAPWQPLGPWFNGAQTHVEGLHSALELLRCMEATRIPRGIEPLFAEESSPAVFATLLHQTVGELFSKQGDWEKLRQQLQKHGDLAQEWLHLETHLENDPGCVRHLESLLEHSDDFARWCLFSHSHSACVRNRLKPFLDLALRGEIAPEQIAAAYERVVCENAISDFIRQQPALLHFSRQRHEETRNSFQQLDRQWIQINRQLVAHELAQRQPPPGNARGKVSEYTEMGLVRHEIQKQKRHCRIRDLMRRAGASVQTLKPCFMMSPLSVSQYLPPDGVQFDIVIMDEASQIKPEDALGTVMRARQLIVVGDPKQMPPSSTFDRQDEDVDEEEAVQMDNTESILEVASKTFQPLRRLRWHYRSKHEHLIQFSNERFYDGDLVVFPSPGSDRGSLGVFLHKIEEGFFHKGQNRVEAEMIVESIVAHAINHPQESLGVGALNVHQARLISDLLDKRCEQDPVARAAREQLDQTHPFEKLFIKNLENLQGDERDVVFISYTYGKDPASGRVFKRFGPMAQEVGWRRFNVLITRARKRLEVFSSMTPLDIGGGPDKSKGINAMRDFLEFCGTLQIPDRQIHSGREPGSEFEISVGRVLTEMGVRYVPQVGVAGFFIDLGVLHPESNNDFVLGIECDGASYHSSKSARDRDRLRQEIIESRGWRIHRIWSTDWFQNQKFEIERLRQAILSSMPKEEGSPDTSLSQQTN